MSSLADTEMSAAVPRIIVLGWWSITRACGRMSRRPGAAPSSTIVAALAAMPVTIVNTGARTNRIMSKMAKPSSAMPPGLFTNSLIGLTGSIVSNSRSWLVTSRVSFGSMGP